jgi:hypothetical protein
MADSQNDNSNNSDNSINIGDIDLDVALAQSELSATVSGNSVDMGNGDYTYRVNNTIDNGSFANTNGINQSAQNNGHNSLIQQNFTVQANVNGAGNTN